MKKKWKNCVLMLSEHSRFSLILAWICVLMTYNLMPVNAHGQNQDMVVSVSFEGADFNTVVTELRRQTACSFVYSADDVATLLPVTLSMNNVKLSKVLDQISEVNGLRYFIEDKTVVIRKKDLSTPNVDNGSRVVSGKVTDSKTGEPIIGANIIIKGTYKGTITDVNGDYKVQVKDNGDQVLVITFIGMKTQEVPVGHRLLINVKMEEDLQVIDDVVVTGAYGTMQKRSDMVGSAYQVNSKEFETMPATRVDMLLDGLVPGLTIDPNDDSAGNVRGRNNIRVRGDASMAASNEPLWIVDGVPIYTGDRTNQVTGMNSAVSPLSFLNPSDIESITVLKDAATVSIYGADGANGIMLVTTKKGRTGKTAINFSTTYGVSHINNSTKYKVLNAEDYMKLAKEAYANAGRDMKYFPFQDNDINQYSSTYTDWYDQYYGLGGQLNGVLSISGGNQGVSYYVSGSYFKDEHTVIGNMQERYSIRSKTDIQLSKRLKLDLNLSASYNVNDIFNAGREYYDYLPIVSPYYDDGNFRLHNKFIDGMDSEGNPVWRSTKFFNSLAEREENDNIQKTFVSNTNIKLEYQLMEGLSMTSQLGLEYVSGYEENYYAKTNWSGMSLDGRAIGYSYRGHVNHLNWINIDRLNFNKTIDKHTIGALAGFEIKSEKYNGVNARGSGFVNDHIKEIGYAVDQRGSSFGGEKHSMSFFMQGSYSFDRRYYLTLNARKDGNSDFGSDVRWSQFGSVGASWNIHNEEFFASSVINVLKLKGSYGTNGNSRLGSVKSQGLYSYNDSDSYMSQPGGSMSNSANSKLSWETTYMTNIGVRLSLLNRLDIEVEAYRNKTVDLLSKLDVSRITGDLRVYRNVGEIQNQGIELTLITQNIEQDDFKWSTNLNMSHNKNKLIKLYNGIEKVMGTTIWQEGRDINTYYLVRWAGVDPRDGMPMWYDKYGNITRTLSYDDRVAYKTSTPTVSGGVSNTFAYKNFNVRVLLNYEIGGYAFSSFERSANSDGLNIMDENQSVNQLDRWQKPGDLALSPKMLWGISTKSVMNSTRYLYSRTHVRLQHISVSYTLPQHFVNRMGIGNCNISFLTDNLGVWTLYDKEGRNSFRNAMRGYPMETTYSLSLNLSF